MASSVRAILLIELDTPTPIVSPDATLTATRPFFVYDAHTITTTQGALNDATIVARQAGGSGGFNAVTGNMVQSNGGVGDVVRAPSLVAAQQGFIVGDVMRQDFAVGNTVRAQGYVRIIPRPIT